MRVFAYLDIQHPPVAWAVMRGVLISADRAPDSSPGFVSFMIAGLIQYQCNTRLGNETIIEHVRALEFSKLISRLSGMYFFEDRNSAQKAIEEKWGAHFRIENLVELELIAHSPITKVDANWITNAPRNEKGQLETSDLSWIRKYWSGETYGKDPTWELIASCEATILTTAAREAAYEAAKKEFPKSWEFIEMSRLATETGAMHGGLITPFIRKTDENRFRLDYLFYDAAFKDASVVQKMTTHPNWGRLAEYARANSDKDLIVPDFREWSQEFEMKSFQATNLAVSIQSVHHSS